MSESVITRHDIEHFTFREYRKLGTTKLSNETLEVGQRVQTLEGEYVCGELSRLAIDAKGSVYPVAESVFAVSYEPAGADPSAEIDRLRADVERLEREVAERADEAESDHRGILRLGGEIDCLKADNKILRADVERLRGLLEKIRSPVERMRTSVMQAWPNVVYVDIRIAGHDFKDIADFLAGLEQPCKP